MIDLCISPVRKVEPATMEDYERVRRLKPGTALTARSWGERNLKQHRYWRALLTAIADNWQGKKITADQVHELIKLEVGFADMVVDQHGEVKWITKRTDFSTCSQVEFDDYLKKATEVAMQMLGDVDRDALDRFLNRETSWTSG